MGDLSFIAEAIPSEPVMQSRKTEVSRSHSTEESREIGRREGLNLWSRGVLFGVLKVRGERKKKTLGLRNEFLEKSPSE